MRDTAVFYLTHLWTESVAFRFARLWREASNHADCFVLLHDDDGIVTRRWRAFLQSINASAALRTFKPETLASELGVALYGGDNVLGNTHLPLVQAAQSGPWHHCWQIESDAEYRGNWSDFLQLFDSSRADLLASHIHRHHHWPTWRWWKSLATPGGAEVDAAELLKAFFPVFRISRLAVDALLQAHREGWTGHFEVLVPTVVARHALRVEDLRANVPCYVDDSQDPNPIIPLQSTMRWRPEVRLQEFASRASGPLLFHPVKQNWAYEADGVRRWPEPQQGAGS